MQTRTPKPDIFFNKVAQRRIFPEDFFFSFKGKFLKGCGDEVVPSTILLGLPNPVASSPAQMGQKVIAVATLINLKNDVSENDFYQSIHKYQW